jgi:hypothetical protein
VEDDENENNATDEIPEAGSKRGMGDDGRTASGTLRVTLYSVENYYYLLIVIKNTHYALRAARPWVADTPGGGWPPAWPCAQGISL